MKKSKKEVPDNILPHFPYEDKEDLFSCPQLTELKKIQIDLIDFPKYILAT